MTDAAKPTTVLAMCDEIERPRAEGDHMNRPHDKKAVGAFFGLGCHPGMSVGAFGSSTPGKFGQAGIVGLHQGCAT